MTFKIGVIGGTGLYDPDILSDAKEKTVNTLYGDAAVVEGKLEDREVVFLTRHGKGHTVPPHLVNYRANISALKELGVEAVIATASVGSLNREMKPGDLVILDQFIDFTKNRPLTFCEGGSNGVVHTDVTEPYCPELRNVLFKLKSESDFEIHPEGTYVGTEGPRFETAAEIDMFQQLGGELVGMTNVPEVILAREKGICYATVAIVTNFAAGISPNPLSHSEVVEAMQTSAKDIQVLLKNCIPRIPQTRNCNCSYNQ